MKILQVHKYLYRKAGAEAYVLDLAQLLVKHGQEVGLWGTAHNPSPPPLTLRGGDDRNSPLRVRGDRGVTTFEDLLVEPLNFDRREGLWRDIQKFGHMVWSREAARKFERVMHEFRPDIVHIHNIYHHISPSILSVAARYNTPVVGSVHDYHLINPNYALFDHGEICERQGIAAIAYRCIKNSYLATLADVVERRVHRMLRVYEKNVAKFIVPTEFVKEKLVRGGMDAQKIIVIPLPVAPSPGLRLPSPIKGEGVQQNPPPSVGGVRGGGRGYILFAGRLTVEKGVYLILELAKHLPEIKFKIVGTGPEADKLQSRITNYQLRNVELLGFQDKSTLQQLIQGAKLIIVPSLWYEPSPYAVLEAMAAGKVVVASQIGGIPELIEEGKTGFFISPIGHIRPIGPILDTIRKIYYDEALLKRVGKAAQEYVKRAHDPEKHYEKIMEIYGRVIGY